MESILNSLAEEPALLIPLLAIGGGLMLGMVGMIADAVKRVSRTNAVEKSRREIAAYIAEGSMTPEDGERLLRAGRGSKSA
jgi:hypothetical protein